jgi:hypothetical protein
MDEQQGRIVFLEQQVKDQLAVLEQHQREKSAASDEREREERAALAAFEQKMHDSWPKTPTVDTNSKLTTRYEQAISLPVVSSAAAPVVTSAAAVED